MTLNEQERQDIRIQVEEELVEIFDGRLNTIRRAYENQQKELLAACRLFEDPVRHLEATPAGFFIYRLKKEDVEQIAEAIRNATSQAQDTPDPERDFTRELLDHLDYCGWGDSWERECSRDLQRRAEEWRKKDAAEKHARVQDTAGTGPGDHKRRRTHTQKG